MRDVREAKFNNPHQEDLSFLYQSLIQRYQDIEARGIQVIKDGLVVENMGIKGKTEDSRYSIAAIGRINGSFGVFLSQSIEKIREVEPDIHFVPNGFRHITFREIAFSENGRKGASIDSKRVLDYYRALREGNFQNLPVNLELYRIIASIDKEQNSVSIIACLLPKDSNIVNVRNQINSSISKVSLPFIGRLGNIKLAYVTLARLPNPPKREENNVPLLDIIEKINNSIPEDCQTEIKNIDVISTTKISYVDVSKHIYIWPPVSLTGSQIQDRTCYLRPKQRLQK